MTLDITPVSSNDSAAIEAWCQVIAAIRAHDVPKWRENPPRMFQLVFKVPTPGYRFEGYLAWLKGRPVARIMLEVPTRENLENLDVSIWVIPQERRRGLGRRLHEFALKRAHELGRKRLIGTTLWELPGIPAPNLDGVEFVRRLGYSSALTDVVRRLDLTTVDEAVLAALHEQASAKADGYRIVQWMGVPPDEYTDDLAYLESRLMTDAPTGDLKVEPQQIDSTRLRESQVAAAARERLNYHTAAMHEESGRLVAWTTISKEKCLAWNAFQQITIVEPAHRGRRLGALVKLENLRYLREAEPTVTAIDTFNADENTHMVSINEQLGFRPLYAFQNWQRDI